MLYFRAVSCSSIRKPAAGSIEQRLLVGDDHGLDVGNAERRKRGVPSRTRSVMPDLQQHIIVGAAAAAVRPAGHDQSRNGG